MVACAVRKLKHTVNKVSSLRDFHIVRSIACRKLKHTVNKVPSLRDFAGWGIVPARHSVRNVKLGRNNKYPPPFFIPQECYIPAE
jgi:hypothetical protein